MTAPHPNSQLQALLRTGCRVAVGVVALLVGAWGQAEEADRIVPIRFADLTASENAPVEALMIPSVIVEDDLVPNEAVAPLETVPSPEPAAPPLEEVSARAADGLRIQDFGVDEMPYEASSSEWFSNGN